MSLRIAFRPIAEAEFEQPYEGQHAGLGDDFIAEVQEVLDTIKEHPERYPIASGDVREALVSISLLRLLPRSVGSYRRHCRVSFIQ